MSLRKAILAAIAVSAFTATPAYAILPSFKDQGGPVMSGARWVEVVWGSAIQTEDPTLPATVSQYLTDISAASGTTGNLFGVTAQYGVPYQQSFAGQFTISPSKCATTTSACGLNQSDVQSELSKDTADGTLPAPTGDGLSTAYIVVFPSSITITDNYNDNSGTKWCAEHSDVNASPHIVFAMLPDLGSLAGCGSYPTSSTNVIVTLSHEQSDMLTDPLAADATTSPGPPEAWYDTTFGEIAIACSKLYSGTNQNVAQTINGDSWTVERVWSNRDDACEGSTNEYTTPAASFTDLASGASVGFAAVEQTTNGSGPFAAYSWDFGDGTTGTGQTPTHTYAASGIYTVTLRAIDNVGFDAPAVSRSVTVTVPPAPSPAPSGGVLGSLTSTPLATLAASGSLSTKTSGRTFSITAGHAATCPAGAGACTLKISVTVAGRPKPTTIAQTTITIPAGKRVAIAFTLNSKGASLLRKRKHFSATLQLTLTHGHDRPVTSKSTITIKAPKR
jgi:hypothetical protein